MKVRTEPPSQMSAARVLTAVAAVALFAASAEIIYLTYEPSGLGTLFGDDDIGPLEGFIFMGITIAGCLSLLRWPQLRWLGVVVSILLATFWVIVALNTTPAGPSPLLAGLYLVAAASLAVSPLLNST